MGKSSSRIKIVVLVAMYNRIKISELFLIAMNRFIKDNSEYDFEIIPIISEDNYKELCSKYNLEYVFSENKPVSNKWNNGLSYVMKNKDFDYLMIAGDDDIADSRLMRYYKPYIDNGCHYFGVKDIYFYHSTSGTSMLFSYKHKHDKLIGCFRMISRYALERSCAFVGVAPRKKLRIGEMVFEIGKEKFINKYVADYLFDLEAIVISSDVEYNFFGKNLNSGLDFHSEGLLVMSGFYPQAIISETPLVTDIKSDQNIWTFSKYVNHCKLVKRFTPLSFFTQEEIDYLKDNFPVK